METSLYWPFRHWKFI